MLFVAAIQVASFGALQFSFGATLPPNSSMVRSIASWVSRQLALGSGLSSSSSSLLSAPEKMPLSLSDHEGPSFSSGGRMMPSERRYSTKAEGSGMRRALGVIARYLMGRQKVQ
jgi:hypothetical protein